MHPTCPSLCIYLYLSIRNALVVIVTHYTQRYMFTSMSLEMSLEMSGLNVVNPTHPYAPSLVCR
jgi:hypothetical protein